MLYDFDLIINSTSITKLNEVSVDCSSILLVTKIFKLISNKILSVYLLVKLDLEIYTLRQ